MLTDALLQLSSAQAVTATAVSTNTIDLGKNRDIGSGSDLYLTVGVNTTATAAGAATVNIQVVTSAAADLSSPTVLVQTDALAKTELTAGRRPISLCIPNSAILAQPIGQRYLGVRYVVATGPLTTGAFTAAITYTEVDADKNYPSGFSVY